MVVRNFECGLYHNQPSCKKSEGFKRRLLHVSLQLMAISFVSDMYAMQDTTGVSAVPSLRTRALTVLTHLLTNAHALDTKTYVQLSRQIRKSYIPDEIARDIIAGLKKTQDSFAIPIQIGSQEIDCQRQEVRFDATRRYVSCFYPSCAIHFYDTTKGKRRGIYITKHRIIDYDWHPTDSEIVVITDTKLLILDPKARVIKKSAYTSIGPSHTTKVAWSKNGEHVIIQSGFRHDLLERSTGRVVFATTIVCDVCRNRELGTIFYPYSGTPHSKANPGCLVCKHNANMVRFQDIQDCNYSWKLDRSHKTLTLLNQNTQHLFTYTTQDDIVNCAVSHDGRYFAWLVSHPRDRKRLVHTFDTLTSDHAYTSLEPIGDVTMLAWYPSDYRLLVYSIDLDVYLMDGAHLTQLLHHDQSNAGYTWMRPCHYRPLTDQILLQSLHNTTWAVLLDTSLIQPNTPLSVHDQLMGLLAMTNRYKELKKKYRSQIAFEKDIDDTRLAKKLRASLKALDT